MLNRLTSLARISCVVLMASGCSPQPDDATPTEDPARGITNITGNLYEARDLAHNTVFLVTPDGVILGDPMGADSAQWLKEEIAERFGTPVKYVIYSHHHPEHATGGRVFADTATFVAHENTIAALNAPFNSVIGSQALLEVRSGARRSLIIPRTHCIGFADPKAAPCFSARHAMPYAEWNIPRPAPVQLPVPALNDSLIAAILYPSTNHHYIEGTAKHCKRGASGIERLGRVSPAKTSCDAYGIARAWTTHESRTTISR